MAVKALEEREVDKWKMQNLTLLEGDNNLVPKFNMFTWNYKFGNTPKRVEAIILAIRAKRKDIVYLKCLIAAGYAQGIFDREVSSHTEFKSKRVQNSLKTYSESITTT
eukprot:526807-Ditylum_brightwellii.AAC.1